MKNDNDSTGRVEVALGVIAADGFFCAAFLLHLLGLPPGCIDVWHFLATGVILSVFCTSCWVIYDDYWLGKDGAGKGSAGPVKTLRIRELEEGAAIEYDGRSYRVRTIDRANGEIHIARVGSPGSIVVQIEGKP